MNGDAVKGRAGTGGVAARLGGAGGRGEAVASGEAVDTVDRREDEEAVESREDEEAGSGPRFAARRWWPSAVVGGALVALFLAWAGWLLAGGGLYWVSSPSMGEAIPEGSLVASMPIPTGGVIRTGEVIAFREPGTSTVFVHRVVEVLPGERYLTKGDLERTPDPWVLQRSGVIGRVRATVPAVGWIYHSATWFFLGAAVLVVTSMFAGRRTRRWIRLLGPVVLLAVPLLRYRPLVDGYVLQSTQHGTVGAAHIVDSGILPVVFTMKNGRSTYAAPGQAVDVTGQVPAHGTGPHGVPIHIAASLPWWGWLIVVLLCLTPLLALEMDVRRRRALAALAAPGGEGAARSVGGNAPGGAPAGDHDAPDD